MKITCKLIFLLTLISISLPAITCAVEVAPRISDREIIEILAELKAGQRSIEQRFDTQNKQSDARFNAQNKQFDARFDAQNKQFDARFDAQNKQFDARFDAQDKHFNARFDAQNKLFNARFDAQDKRFDAQDKRFDDFNRRLDSIERTMLTMFSVMISLIIAIFAYIAWDRRTAMRPMQERLEVLEKDIAHDLELSHKMGSRLTRVVEALRDLAKTNPQVAEVLRSFSLL